MPWYLVYAHHGGGHQSKTVEFRWSSVELDEEELKWMWESIFDGYEFDGPIGACIRLDGLTEDQRESKRREYVGERRNAVQMLRVVKETAVIEHMPIDESGKICSCGERRYLCSRCGKDLCYKCQPDWGWCPDCMSCGDGEHEWRSSTPVVCVKCGVEHPFERYWARQRQKDKGGMNERA